MIRTIWRRLDAWYGWLVGSKEGFVVLIFAVAALLAAAALYGLATGRFS